MINLENVLVNILSCNTLYDYYLASYQNYECFDLMLDYSINPTYTCNSAYLKEIYKYI